MFDAWRVGYFWDETRIARGFNVQVPQGASLLSRHEALWQINNWFGDDLRSRFLLVDICAALGVSRVMAQNIGTDYFRREVSRALNDGRLVAYRVHRGMSAGASAPKAKPDDPQELEPEWEQPKSWIAIELMDDSDPPKPAAFMRYRIELPNHSVREGMLDANGQVWINGIDEGACIISFPQLDAKDWQAA